MPAQTLSALDAEFLHVEDAHAPMHIGGIAVFDGPPPSYDELCASLAAKLHLIPRYRQRVRSVPLDLGRPVWVDDPHFSLGYHVRHTALPRPGGDDELTRLMSRLMSHTLDRSRPLWETWLVEGLDDDRWALIFKVHHCMVDGVAGVGLLTALLDLDPQASLPEPQPWEPEPDPSSVALVGGAWSGLAGDLAHRAGQLVDLARHPDRAVRTGRDTVEGLVGFGRHLTPVPSLTIEGPIGPHRTWTFSTASFADVRTIRAAFGGTINDVVLAAVTSGFRDLLRHHGDVVETAVIRTAVPVSMRGDDGQGVPDNRVSVLLVELPVTVDDPLERLAAIRSTMAASKGSHMADAGQALTSVSDLAPPMVVGVASRMVMRALRRLTQHSVTTVTTNVPGPQFPLYCLGREMTGYLPYVPIVDSVRVGTAILSYNGTLAFGVTGDQDTVPDVGVLTDGIAAGIAELVALAEATEPAATGRKKSGGA